MILSSQSISARGSYAGTPSLVTPMLSRRVHETGLSYGLGPCGYDIRIKQAMTLPRGVFRLASSVERFCMPNDLCAHVRDKSTLIRSGLLVGNTVIEPGWRGYLTLELFYLGSGTLYLAAGQPIAQVQFTMLDQPTQAAYEGKYQDQPDDIVQPLAEGQGGESPAEYIKNRVRLPLPEVA